jgi:hypothetical protein
LPNGCFCTLGRFLGKITQVAENVLLFFSTVNVVYEFILTKNGLDYTLDHLVTNSSGHPASKWILLATHTSWECCVWSLFQIIFFLEKLFTNFLAKIFPKS